MAKSYDQYMAESGQQHVLDQQRASGTYDQAMKSYGSGGGQVLGASTGNSGGGLDFESVLAKAKQMASDSIQPAISAYQSQVAPTQAIYAQERERLSGEMESVKQRTQQLIEQLTGQKQQAEQAQTLTTSNELGRRGITGASGLAEQEMNKALQPIGQQYGSLLTQAGQTQEDSLRQIQSALGMLAPQEQNALAGINQAIAQLQSGIYGNAMQGANTMYGNQMAGQQYADQLSQYNDMLPLQQQLMQAQIGATNRSNISSGSGGGGGALDLAGLWNQFNGADQTTAQPTTQYSSQALGNDPVARAKADARMAGARTTYASPLANEQVQGASTGGGLTSWIKNLFGGKSSSGSW